MEIETKDVTKEHIEYALNYIVRHGQRGRNDIFYLHNAAPKRGIEYKVDGKDEHVAVRDTIRVAVLYAENRIPKEGEISKEEADTASWILKSNGPKAFAESRGFVVKIFGDDSEDDESDGVDKAIDLLKQFGQIIFHGPPGTGKTYLAKMILRELFDIDNKKDMDALQGDRWDIVQFHPSYNYEDFVRGVKVKTKDGTVVYETIDSVFGKICKLAAKASEDKKFVLIIDEINRANVSAVLGELIYALEYRDEKVETPYAVDGSFKLIVPKNLYIIGTMNTADRTIGQIDYAVRRRFAFVHCPPDDRVIDDDDALRVFSKVEEIFNKHISPDYDADDVRIGHSYFLAKGGNLARKIVYQVVPILREYVKDGILLEGAKDEISKIHGDFERDVTISDMSEEESGKESAVELTTELTTEAAEVIDREVPKGRAFYCWEKNGRIGINNVGRTVLSIAHDYVSQHPEKTIEEVQEWFPDRAKHAQNRGIKAVVVNRDRFFTRTEDKLIISGKPAYVTSQWVEKKSTKGNVVSLEEFVEGVKENGYAVRRCYVVKIAERDKKRSWDACKDFGFVAANGVMASGRSYTKLLRELDTDDIVFAFLNEDSEGNKGFIGMGKVLEKAVRIDQFKVDGISILDYSFSDGQKYRDKYPDAAEQASNEDVCEWMVRVNWMKVLSREEAEGTTVRQHVTYNLVNPSNLKIIKAKFEGAE